MSGYIAGSSLAVTRWRITAVAVVLVLVGCASIRVRPVPGPSLSTSLSPNRLSERRLSPRTLQTIRQFDLDELYPRQLGDLADRLHDRAVVDPQPDLLFALAEIYHLRAVQAENNMQSAEALCFSYISAGYAYHYLFDRYRVPIESQGIQQAIGITLEARRAAPFDPRFRLACDLYNLGLAKCLQAASLQGRFDPRGYLCLPGSTGDSESRLAVRHTGFAFRPEEFGPVQLCSAYEVSGLPNQHRTYGLGVPLIGSRHPEAPRPTHSYYPAHANFPITAFFHFEGGLTALRDRRAGWLELVNPLSKQQLQVAGLAVPLETDLTTPLAYFLANAELDSAGYIGFLSPDSLRGRAGLHTLEPYQPGKIPVILIHGLLGSPLTWAPLFNDLQADPLLRRRFQFWVYFYPTGSPYLATAAALRRELNGMCQALDPQGRDRALSSMVLIGHSMGGLVSRLLTVSGGDDFWHLVTPESLAAQRLDPQAREQLQQMFYFERLPQVRRAIFLGTPHRGSKVSPSVLGRIGARLAGLPRAMSSLFSDIVEENPRLALELRRVSPPSSIDLLDPNAPALQLLSHRPRPEQVTYHSVIGVSPRNVLLIERLLGGGYRQPSDGVVPYASAHLDEAESELVVDADHYNVHKHPLAILEVRRILLEHARQFDAEGEVIPAEARQASPADQTKGN